MIEQKITLNAGTSDEKTLKFVFTHDTVKRFSLVGGNPTGILADPIGNMEAFIKACIIDEGTISNSKAEKLYDAIDAEYEILDVLGILAEKYNEVFIGGENAPKKKRLSDEK